MQPLQGRDRVALWVATSGGLGWWPHWPGTVGAAAGMALAALLLPFGAPGLLIGAFALLFVGVWAAGIVEQRFGTDDPQIVVIDESFGAILTLAMVPPQAVYWLLGFVAFRALDIVKPWPVNRFHHIRGGWGIMLDDGAAAVLAGLSVALLAQFVAAIVQ